MGISLKPQGTHGNDKFAIAIGGFLSFGGFLFGYDTGTISGILAMPAFLHQFATESSIQPDGSVTYALTTSQTSEIVSVLSAGEFFGALLSAPLADSIGRKLGLIASTLVFMLGIIFQTASSGIPLLVAGRFFAGLGVGLVSAQVPLYQSETAPKWARGPIVGSYQFAITIGLFVAACVNYGTSQMDSSAAYRIPIALQFAWGLILIAGMLSLPETPRYLIKQGKGEAAAAALSRIRRLPITDPTLQAELAEIKANYEYEVSLGKASYIECFRGNIGKRLATGCLLQALQQLTGVNFIFYYGTVFFASTNAFSNAFIIQVITNIVNVFSTIPGLYAVERMGRRSTLLIGAVGMAVSQLLVAILGTVFIKQYTLSDAPSPSLIGANYTINFPATKALIAFVCFYIFFFASTWGPNAWVVTGEIFPLKARAKCLSMTTASNWLLNWAIAYSTPYLVDYGQGYANLQAKVFFIWGGFCVICVGFVWALIYETKGMSLEQVDDMYLKVSHAWKSAEFNRAKKLEASQAAAMMEEDDGGHGGAAFGMEPEKGGKESPLHIDERATFARSNA